MSVFTGGPPACNPGGFDTVLGAVYQPPGSAGQGGQLVIPPGTTVGLGDIDATPVLGLTYGHTAEAAHSTMILQVTPSAQHPEQFIVVDPRNDPGLHRPVRLQGTTMTQALQNFLGAHAHASVHNQLRNFDLMLPTAGMLQRYGNRVGRNIRSIDQNTLDLLQS